MLTRPGSAIAGFTAGAVTSTVSAIVATPSAASTITAEASGTVTWRSWVANPCSSTLTV
jgi:hypothetical protein